MKLSVIKIEALKLIFADYKNVYDPDDITDLYEDDNYAKYLNAMNGSINRCFDRMRSERKQPQKTLVLDKTDMEEDDFLVYDISETFTNYDGLVRVSYRYADQKVYLPQIDYQIEGDTLYVENDYGNFTAIYYEAFPFLSLTEDRDTLDQTDITISDDLARILPYWIKGELFEEDEPELANQARMLFETYLRALYEEPKIRQTRVKRMI